MDLIPEITTIEDINKKLNELESLINIGTTLITFIGHLKTKLSLDFSPDLSELGKSADVMKTIRDKVINDKILRLGLLVGNLQVMYNTIKPGILNSDFNKTITEQDDSKDTNKNY